MEAKSKIAFVLGNEINGVDQEVIDACHGVIEIPQTGFKHSLNISIAAGIVSWEVYRQLI
jgi:tRNA G18 (ribose-2'-O)-methylase SpoU